jgi:hypothetical protein
MFTANIMIPTNIPWGQYFPPYNVPCPPPAPRGRWVWEPEPWDYFPAPQQPCLIEEFFRAHPKERSCFIYCSCPRCSPTY